MSNERYLMRRLLDGLSAWLTYKQAANAKTLYNEHFLYPPIHDIVTGREWMVRAQQPLKRKIKGGGANRTIDFVFYRVGNPDRRAGLVFLEVKYLKNSNSTRQFTSLTSDIVKLRDISTMDLQGGAFAPDCSPKKFILVVSQQDDLRALVKVQFKKSQVLVAMLASALRRKPPRGIYRSIVKTRLKKEFHWNVIAFGESAWPD